MSRQQERKVLFDRFFVRLRPFQRSDQTRQERRKVARAFAVGKYRELHNLTKPEVSLQDTRVQDFSAARFQRATR